MPTHELQFISATNLPLVRPIRKNHPDLNHLIKEGIHLHDVGELGLVANKLLICLAAPLRPQGLAHTLNANFVLKIAAKNAAAFIFSPEAFALQLAVLADGLGWF